MLSKIKCKHCGLSPKFEDIKYKLSEDDIITDIECQCVCGEHFKKEEDFNFLDILLEYLLVKEDPIKSDEFINSVSEGRFTGLTDGSNKLYVGDLCKYPDGDFVKPIELLKGEFCFNSILLEEALEYGLYKVQKEKIKLRVYLKKEDRYIEFENLKLISSGDDWEEKHYRLEADMTEECEPKTQGYVHDDFSVSENEDDYVIEIIN